MVDNFRSIVYLTALISFIYAHNWTAQKIDSLEHGDPPKFNNGWSKCAQFLTSFQWKSNHSHIPWCRLENPPMRAKDQYQHIANKMKIMNNGKAHLMGEFQLANSEVVTCGDSFMGNQNRWLLQYPSIDLPIWPLHSLREEG